MARKTKTPPARTLTVDVWEERDRLHVRVSADEGQTDVADWWDDDARQMFEDGFFDRRNLAASVLEYCASVGIR